MTAILHITNGSCSQRVMQQAGIQGDIFTWDDVLHEGPVPADMTLPELSTIRARFIAEQCGKSCDEVLDAFIARDNALMSFQDYDALYLWFEHDLYDQLQLIQILNWLATQDLKDSNIQLICEPCYLGCISANEMSALQGKAKPVTYEQIAIATTAWQAFTLPTPEEWFRLLQQDTKSLPFLQGAVLRLLQEYPHVKNVSFDELISNSDIITFHCKSTTDGKPLITKEHYSKMKSTAYIINAARGNIVDENDLNEALNENLIAGAALDVFSKEPAKENILFNNPKVILTPHIAASTTEASIVVAEMVANQISDFLLNGTKINTV